MSDEKGLYEGRKGQRRLKLIEKNIQRTNEEFDHNCEESPEMIYLDRQIKWEGMARLIFTLAQRDVNFRWSGLRDYGYITDDSHGRCGRCYDERHTAGRYVFGARR